MGWVTGYDENGDSYDYWQNEGNDWSGQPGDAGYQELDDQGNLWEVDPTAVGGWRKVYDAAEQATIDAGLKNAVAGNSTTASGEFISPTTMSTISQIARQNAQLSAAAAAGNRQAAVMLAELQYRMRQGELDTGLDILNLVAKLGGPASAFQQQNVLHGVNQQGLSRAVDAIAGRIVLPTTQAPQATPEAMTLDSLLKQLGANPSAASPFSVPAMMAAGGPRAAAPRAVAARNVRTVNTFGTAPTPAMVAGARELVRTQGPGVRIPTDAFYDAEGNWIGGAKDLENTVDLKPYAGTHFIGGNGEPYHVDDMGNLIHDVPEGTLGTRAPDYDPSLGRYTYIGGDPMRMVAAARKGGNLGEDWLDRLKAAAGGEQPASPEPTFVGGDPMLDQGYVLDPESGLYYDPTMDINLDEAWKNPDGSTWNSQPEEPTEDNQPTDEIPQDASGGLVRTSPHIVGEAGPELAKWTPFGTAIVPLNRPPTGLMRDMRSMMRGRRPMRTMMADGGFIAGEAAPGILPLDTKESQWSWADTSRGSPQEGMMYGQVITPVNLGDPTEVARWNQQNPDNQIPIGFTGGGPADDSGKWAGQSNQPQETVPEEPDWLKQLPRNDTNLARARQYLSNNPQMGFGGDFGPAPDWNTVDPEYVWHQLSTQQSSDPAGAKRALDYVRQAARTYSPDTDGSAADTMDDAAFYQYAKGRGLLEHLGGADNPNRVNLAAWAGEAPSAFTAPTNVGSGAPITDIKEYAKALPNPNQIVGREWMKLPDSSKQFLLSAYKDMGWDTSDVVDAIVKGLPGAASFRAPFALTRR